MEPGHAVQTKALNPGMGLAHDVWLSEEPALRCPPESRNAFRRTPESAADRQVDAVVVGSRKDKPGFAQSALTRTVAFHRDNGVNERQRRTNEGVNVDQQVGKEVGREV